MGIDVTHGSGHRICFFRSKLCTGRNIGGHHGIRVICCNDPFGIGLQLKVRELQIILVEIIDKAAAGAEINAIRHFE